jgi:hypothetical protein
MKTPIRAPKPGESITKVTIETIHIQNGEHAQKDDLLITFSSDKVDIDVFAAESGIIEYYGNVLEDIEIMADSIIGHIVSMNTLSDSKTHQTGQPVETVLSIPSNQQSTGESLYNPRPWQTDPDIVRLVKTNYANILGANPSEEAKKAAIVGIFCYQEQGEDKGHECDHLALLEELRRDPDLVVGLFSFCLPRQSADFKHSHMRDHANEFFETYLQASPILAEILRFPNVAPFSILCDGDLSECFEFKQKFFDHMTYDGNHLSKR